MVEGLGDTKINHAHIIGELHGGIDIEMKQDVFLGESALLLKQGKQHIDRSTTLSLVRERHSLQNGDFGRQFNQSQVLKEAAMKLLQPKI